MARKIPEAIASYHSIRRYLAEPIDTWRFPPQWLASVVGYTDAELAWFKRPLWR